MALCDVCKKNVAVIFISKMEEGQRVNQGLCMSCAQENGIEPLSHMIKQSGMSDDDMENLNKQMSELMNNVNLEDLALPNNEGEDIDKNENPLLKMFTPKDKADENEEPTNKFKKKY